MSTLELFDNRPDFALPKKQKIKQVSMIPDSELLSNQEAVRINDFFTKYAIPISFYSDYLNPANYPKLLEVASRKVVLKQKFKQEFHDSFR